jgi:hypothetical protein
VSELDWLKGCELHLHIVGAFYPDDALALGGTVYREVDWHANGFLETYQALFGVHPDPIGIFDDAIANGGAPSNASGACILTQKPMAVTSASSRRSSTSSSASGIITAVRVLVQKSWYSDA